MRVVDKYGSRPQPPTPLGSQSLRNTNQQGDHKQWLCHLGSILKTILVSVWHRDGVGYLWNQHHRHRINIHNLQYGLLNCTFTASETQLEMIVHFTRLFIPQVNYRNTQKSSKLIDNNQDYQQAVGITIIGIFIERQREILKCPVLVAVYNCWARSTECQVHSSQKRVLSQSKLR